MQKLRITALSVLLIVAGTPLTLWGADHGHPDSRATPAAKTVHQGYGIVEAVNPDGSTVRVEHEPIESLRWPRMVMELRAKDPEMIEALAEGDEIAFDLERIDGEYVITRIERKMKR